MPFCQRLGRHAKLRRSHAERRRAETSCAAGQSLEDGTRVDQTLSTARLKGGLHVHPGPARS